VNICIAVPRSAPRDYAVSPKISSSLPHYHDEFNLLRPSRVKGRVGDRDQQYRDHNTSYSSRRATPQIAVGFQPLVEVLFSTEPRD
jgi:hypothetical protein